MDDLPNGRCDVCNVPIEDNPSGYGVRVCSNNPSHDCYSDKFRNGGDPYPVLATGCVWITFTADITAEDRDLEESDETRFEDALVDELINERGKYFEVDARDMGGCKILEG